MMGIQDHVTTLPSEHVSFLTEIDVILPVGKPGGSAGHDFLELSSFNGRSLIEWAVEEAIHAGAGRILVVGPAEGTLRWRALVRHLRQVAEACQGRAHGQELQLIFMRHPVDGPEGWDGLIRAAAEQARGSRALVLDPVTLLTAEGRITTFASFMLRRAAALHHDDEALFAIADLPWEEALSLPVVETAAEYPTFSYDRPVASPSLAVFAGRALVPLPFAPVMATAQAAEAFPFETLTQLLLAEGGEAVRLHFHPLDQRFTQRLHMPRMPEPSGLPFTSRLGLAAFAQGWGQSGAANLPAQPINE